MGYFLAHLSFELNQANATTALNYKYLILQDRLLMIQALYLFRRNLLILETKEITLQIL